MKRLREMLVFPEEDINRTLVLLENYLISNEEEKTVKSLT